MVLNAKQIEPKSHLTNQHSIGYCIMEVGKKQPCVHFMSIIDEMNDPFMHFKDQSKSKSI